MDIVTHAEKEDCPEGKYNPLGIIEKLATGAAGVFKAVVGIGGTSEELVVTRTGICGSCSHAKLRGGVLEQCDLCGCATWAKVRNANEKCPINKW